MTFLPENDDGVVGWGNEGTPTHGVWEIVQTLGFASSPQPTI